VEIGQTSVIFLKISDSQRNGSQGQGRYQVINSLICTYTHIHDFNIFVYVFSVDVSKIGESCT
jgi:hypothetical protein